MLPKYLYAPLEYRISKIQEMYNDDYKDAKKHVLDSDKSRAAYYEVITNKAWGDRQNYDLCVNCSVGSERVVGVVCEYVEGRKL